MSWFTGWFIWCNHWEDAIFKSSSQTMWVGYRSQHFYAYIPQTDSTHSRCDIPWHPGIIANRPSPSTTCCLKILQGIMSANRNIAPPFRVEPLIIGINFIFLYDYMLHRLYIHTFYEENKHFTVILEWRFSGIHTLNRKKRRIIHGNLKHKRTTTVCFHDKKATYLFWDQRFCFLDFLGNVADPWEKKTLNKLGGRVWVFCMAFILRGVG